MKKTSAYSIALKLFLVFAVDLPIQAESKLDQFEKQVTNKKGHKTDKHPSKKGLGDELGDIAKKSSGKFLTSLFSHLRSGVKSDQQDLSEKENQTPRIQLPAITYNTLKASYFIQRVDGDIHSHQGQIYAAYRSVAFFHDHVRYVEEFPQDSMRFSNTALLYRILARDKGYWSFGPGVTNLKGNQSHWSLSATNLIGLYLIGNRRDGVSINLNSTFYWLSSNMLNKNDLSVELTMKHVSLHGGYQWHYAKHASFDLNGPFAGLSFQF